MKIYVPTVDELILRLIKISAFWSTIATENKGRNL